MPTYRPPHELYQTYMRFVNRGQYGFAIWRTTLRCVTYATRNWPECYSRLTRLDLRAIYECLSAIPSLPDNPNPGP